jgi:hypothetical protein
MAAPTITSTNPANNAIDVYINKLMLVVFSKDLAPASINANTFLIYRSTDYTQIDVSLTYNSSTFTVTVTPDKVLDQDTTYTLIVVGADQSTDCVKSTLSENLADSETYQFTTGTERDETQQTPQDEVIVEDEYAPAATVPVLTVAPNSDFIITETYPVHRATNLGTLNGDGTVTITQASGVPIPYNLPIVLAPGSVNPSGFYTISATFNEDLLAAGVATYQDWVEIEASPVNGDPAITAVAPSGFVVPASGETLYWTCLDTDSWYENNEIIVTITREVISASGSTLTEEQQFMFTTAFRPLYCTVNKVRAAIGPYIRSIPDDTINRVIFENSLLAYQLSNETYGQAQWTVDNPSFAAKMYTCCKTQYDLLNAELLERSSGAGQMKRLGDFSIQEPLNLSAAIKGPMDAALACMQFWVGKMTGKDARAHPKMVVKGVSSTVTPPMRGVRTWTADNAYDTLGANKRVNRTNKLPNIYSNWS